VEYQSGKLVKKFNATKKNCCTITNCDSMTTQFRSVEPRKKQHSNFYFDVNVEVRVLVVFFQTWAM
jgi:hypothetical protein